MDDFTRFATSVAPMLQRTGWLLTHDQHRAEDLVQETLAKVYVAWTRRRKIDNPAGYARTVLVRLHLDEKRRHRSREVVTDRLPESIHHPDASATIALQQAVADLDETDKTILVLRFYADLSVADTAADLRISENAVRSRTTRAVAKLRKSLGDDFEIDSDANARRS